jgi:hypothetical protein
MKSADTICGKDELYDADKRLKAIGARPYPNPDGSLISSLTCCPTPERRHGPTAPTARPELEAKAALD